MRSFLLSDATTLSDEELEDAQRREEADRTRDEGRKQFAKEISLRVDSLRDLVKSVKGDLLGKGQYPSFLLSSSGSGLIIL
jgi:two-component SAPR family response regulator